MDMKDMDTSGNAKSFSMSKVYLRMPSRSRKEIVLPAGVTFHDVRLTQHILLCVLPIILRYILGHLEFILKEQSSGLPFDLTAPSKSQA